MSTVSKNNNPAPRRATDAYRPNPVLDIAVTVGYLVVTGLAFYTMTYSHTVLGLIAACVGTAIAIRISNFLFITLSKAFSAALLSGPPFNDPMKKSVAAKKFADQGWQLVIHVSMTLAEIYLLRDVQWLARPSTIWSEADQPISLGLKVFYITQLGIWVYTGFSCLFLEFKRKDFLVMMLHHIVTILLVTGSWHFGTQRAGLLVLYCHDFSDIWIDSMKMANYMKLKDRAGYFISEAIYATGMVAWVYFRLYLFPFWVIHSVIFESWRDPRPCGGWWVCDVHPYITSWSLLLTLQVLHVYWFFLLGRIGYRALVQGDIHNQAKVYEGGSDSD